jgi:hypothetical protein
LRSGVATLAILAIVAMAAALPLPGLSSPTAPRAAYAGDGTCGEASSEPSRTWYFAEGYTGEGFQEWLCLFNPQDASSHLKVNLLYDSVTYTQVKPSGQASDPDTNLSTGAGSSHLVEIDLPPRSRITLDINSLAGKDKEVSLHLEAGEPIVAERPMYFTYRGRWKGCTVTSGATSPAQSWYFAEGCTRQGFEEWLLLANPGEEEAPARVFLILEDGSVTLLPLILPPHSRRTVFVNQAVGEGRDVGTRVEANQPICAERVMYFDYHGVWPGGHASSGLSQPRKTYLFAEGYTGAGFEEWLCLYLPRKSGSPDSTEVTLNCLFQDGAERPFQVHLEADKRRTLNINQLAGAGKNVSLELKGEAPFLAERPMYFNYRDYCRGGHVSKGVEEAATHWYLAEGTTRPGFYPYLCLMNPGNEDAKVEVDFTFSNINTITRENTVPARSRLTLDVEAYLGKDRDVSFEIRSDEPVAVERPLYYPTANFEVANAMDHLWDLSVNIGPRIEGTGGEAAAANYLAGVLESYGYQTEIQEVPLPNGSLTRNVIAETGSPAKSTTPIPDNGQILIMGAHYDTKLGTGSPGANDNGSGSVVVLELARCFAEMPARPYLRFVFFGGEERLVEGTELHHFGSRYYVNSLSQDEKEHLVGAIIVDMVGVGSRLYARTMGVGPMDLCNSLLAYAAGAGIYLPYMVSGSYSDHEPFEAAGIPAVWLEYMDDPWYHTPADSFDKVQTAYIENTGRLLEGYIRSP